MKRIIIMLKLTDEQVEQIYPDMTNAEIQKAFEIESSGYDEFEEVKVKVDDID